MLAFLNAFKTSIKPYSKVVDQHRDPVQSVVIKLTPVDTPGVRNPAPK